jgi:Integrase core domain
MTSILNPANLSQKFTKVNRPQTNGIPSGAQEVERVVRTHMQMWHDQHTFKGCQDRQLQLGRFINFYNTVKTHKSLNNATPYEILNQ